MGTVLILILTSYDAEVNTIKAFLSMQVLVEIVYHPIPLRYKPYKSFNLFFFVQVWYSLIRTIFNLSGFQSPASAPAINPNTVEINAEDYVAPRFSRKMKSKVIMITITTKPNQTILKSFKEPFSTEEFVFKLFSQLRQKILEAHANVKDLNLLEAKMNFKRWIACSLDISWIL